MDARNKIATLNDRLNKMKLNGKENAEAQRKIRREIRNLEKVLHEPQDHCAETAEKK